MHNEDHLNELFGKLFENAPQQLIANIRLALRAISKHSCGESLNELRKAQTLFDANKLTLEKWDAELCVVWAWHHFACGDGQKSKDFWHYLARASRLEPDNQNLQLLVDELRAAKS